ncbi:hydrogen peroxide-inducible genes activator [Pseudoalteromonas luteoviolacea]|uniref:LysR family transcriptional regulator n=1 Tax=Pseudoalteromonas luteoviolacea S4054 TaxID=1129367 RepID=A0A0F6ABQ4_9GAMM|nr:hydrogen peroxide-inducible genes activator [Pseudoalteromonas luteoviolacea]AOT08833.1 LysR family transcriptional regulator [Pseudoalteromonas luteoviolacea]AOT13746.1 LysR family transcriptional regulator [Pseudoalteromonas luteoviolacea]AOT18660.1 LysR family transcriptional regulator [Pseudoalteromonas luteoviolacea]KKE83605.1 LysR family transcriptional regulator [Pseudoalteromonas luteoviolacea S4054]KZN72794.1 LysR family transcriptional regulator [Pseudoalteromonas luteoviolacea S4
MVSIKQIIYALAVEKTLHFKKAADACHVSQSTLSTAIHELEKQLGTVIFERNNKHVFVTEQGKVLLDKARKIKLEVDEFMMLSQVDKSPLCRPMKIGVIPTIGPYLLPKVLPDVRQQYPDFKLKIIEEQSHVLTDMLRQGELDAAILALPYQIDGLMAFNFWQEDFYWVSHKDESGAGLQEITSDQFDIAKLMLLKDGHCLKEHALNACNLPQEQKDTTFDSTSLHTLIQMVAGKMGTTLVPQMALDQLIKGESELVALHLNEPGPHRTIALVVRPNYVRTNDITLLQKLFEQALNKHCAMSYCSI